MPLNTQHRDLIILLIITFFYTTCLMLPGPIIAGYCALLGGTGALMGVVSGAGSFVSLFCRPMVGVMVDHFDRQKIGMVGLGFMAIGAAIAAAAPNVWLLLFSRLFSGAGFAISSGTLSTWVSCSLPLDRVGQGMSIYGVVQAIAQAVAPALGLALMEHLGYRISCLVAAICAIVGLLLIVQIRDHQYVVACRGKCKYKFPRISRQMIVPELIPVALIIFLFCIPYNGTGAFLETVATERRLSFGTGTFFSIYAVVLLIVRALLSKTLDKIPFRRITLIAVPFGICSMLCLHWMSSFWQMATAAILLTFAYGMMQPICQAAGIRAVPVKHRGIANCTYYIGLDLGLAVGPTIAGAVYGFAGEKYVFAALAVAPLLSVAVLLICRRTFDKLGL